MCVIWSHTRPTTGGAWGQVRGFPQSPYCSSPHQTCLCSQGRRRSASRSGCTRRCGNGTQRQSKGCLLLRTRGGPRSAAAIRLNYLRSRGHRRRPTARGCRWSCCTGSWRGRRWTWGRRPHRSHPNSLGPSRRRSSGRCTSRPGSGTRPGSMSWGLRDAWESGRWQTCHREPLPTSQHQPSS